MNILQVNASARTEGAVSTRLAGDIVARLLLASPTATVTVRDLAQHPHPALDDAALAALFTPEAERTPEQAARVALDDALIAEVQAADVLVLGMPMYNLGVPAQFKHWIDAISRARVTFRYTENGPEGLLTGKKVFVALTRGGRYRGTDMDTQVPYLEAILSFLGMSDIEFIYAEGLAMGPQAEQQALLEARAAIEAAIASSRCTAGVAR